MGKGVKIRPAGGLGAVIMLPRGLPAGGVTAWSDTAREALEARGHACTVLTEAPSDIAQSDRVRALARQAHEAIGAHFAEGVGKVVLLPQIAGACYAAACVAAGATPQRPVAVVGSMHTDIRYDTELVRRFSPALSGVLCVSHACAEHLRRAGACDTTALGVVRTGVRDDTAGLHALGDAHDPLRLLYVGRLDSYQKRVLSLPLIVQGLRSVGIACALTIAGDGAARGTLHQVCLEIDRIEMLGHVAPDRLPAIYASHDLLLLPSRSEGLGLARIEAAMKGCVPVVSPGGSAEGITPGTDGVVVPCPPDADDVSAAQAFVRSITHVARRPFGPLRAAARDSAIERFGFERFSDRLSGLIINAHPTESNRLACQAIAANPESAAAFTIPADIRSHIERAARALGDDAVVLHGAGDHTIAAWEPLHRSGVRVLAIADDDPQRWGTRMLGVPIIDPSDAASTGAREVLISSWLHEDAIWARRRMYESLGLVVHRIYADSRSPAACIV